MSSVLSQHLHRPVRLLLDVPVPHPCPPACASVSCLGAESVSYSSVTSADSLHVLDAHDVF